MTPPNFLQITEFSFTTAVYTEVEKFLITDDGDKFFARAAKITANVIAAPVFAVAMLIESIIRGVFTIPAKAIHLFIPKQYSRGFEAHALAPLATGSAISAASSANAALSIVTNLFKNKTKKDIFDFIVNTTFSTLDLFKKPLELQLFGTAQVQAQ